MVTVCVHNGNPVHPVGLPDVLHHDGFDVDVAETSGPVHNAHGVVPRRTDQSKAAIHLIPQHCVRNRLASARCNIMALGENRFHFGHTKMDALNIPCSGQSGIEFHQPLNVQNPFLEDLVLSIEQPFFPLRVCLTNSPIKCWKKDQPRSSFGFHPIAFRYGPMRPGLICARTRIFRPTG